MSPETRYKIEELEELTGLSRRLIYDYISRGLVPAAMGSGKGAYYLSEHYDRLRLISLLRTIGFRLERIEEALTTWGSDEITRIVGFAEGRDVQSLDALNEWLTQPVRPDGASQDDLISLFASEAPPDASADESRHDPLPADLRGEARPRVSSADVLDRLRESALRSPNTEEMRTEQLNAEPVERDARPMLKAFGATPRRRLQTSQTWERVQISPDIEISYRHDIDPDQGRLITELIERAKDSLNK